MSEKNKNIILLWKIYYWVILILLILVSSLLIYSMIYNSELLPSTPKENIFSNIYDIGFGFIFLLSIIGLRGYIYEKKYLTKELWIFIYFILLVDYLGTTIYEYYDYTMLMHSFEAILTLPMIFALYRYSLSMNSVWGEGND